MAKTGRSTLNIPYFAQEHSLTCGIAALRMVLAAYGDSATEKELLKQVKLHSFGTFSTDLGYIALKRGHQVECWTMYMPLLAPLNLPLGTKITLKMLGKIEVPARAKMTVHSWKRYLQAGGKLTWGIPTFDQLKPADIISVNAALLGRYWQHWDNGHYIVINKIGKQSTEILDPEPNHDKGKYSLNNNLLQTIWTVNSIQSSNYLMRIEK